MNNDQYLQQIIKSSEDNVYNQLLRLQLPPTQFHKECIKFAPHSFLCFIAATQGQKFEIRDFHFVIAAVLEHLAFLPPELAKRLILAAPPRSGKSTLTQLFIAWLIGLNENSSHIFASYGQRLSVSFTNKIHTILTSPLFKQCFPAYQGFNSGGKTYLAAGGTLLATSVGGAVTGFSAGSNQLLDEIYDRRSRRQGSEPLFGTPGALVVDDPLKSGASEADMEALRGWWLDEANSRRTGNWLQLLIATRFSPRDLHAKLVSWDNLWSSDNPTGWLNLNITGLRGEGWDPVGRPRVGQGLWPGHPTLNEAELTKLKNLNPQKFSALYAGEPIISEVGALKGSDLKSVDYETEPNIYYKLLAIDASFGNNDRADATALCTVGLAMDGSLWVLDSRRVFGDFVAIREAVAAYLAEVTVDEIAIELHANGNALYSELCDAPDRYNSEARIIGMNSRTYGSKEKRLGSVIDLLRLCEWRGGHKEMRDELLAFPHGSTDDLVDAVSWALINVRNSFESAQPVEGGQSVEVATTVW